jgi:hypothetical protein
MQYAHSRGTAGNILSEVDEQTCEPFAAAARQANELIHINLTQLRITPKDCLQVHRVHHARHQ